MELQLKNIGMIKEANVKLDGLTVIAGENDTGKSTVGKALYLIYNSMVVDNFEFEDKTIINYGNLNFFGKNIKTKIFSEKSFNNNSLIKLSKNNEYLEYNDMFCQGKLTRRDIEISSIFFIETPLVWSLQNLFRSSSDIESHLKMIGESVDIPYPFLMKDLYFKLVTESDSIENFDEFFKEITSIIDGEFKKDEDGIFRFYRNNEKFDLIDIATGIKTFGILQVLLDNNRLNSYSLLILDEPEVHLHPKWQLKMAEVIVKLVKSGAKILVNSHSPYMIEALKRYSDREKIQAKTNFYLAEDGKIDKVKESNSQTLVAIYEKLSEPYDVFEEMESERFQNG